MYRLTDHKIIFVRSVSLRNHREAVDIVSKAITKCIGSDKAANSDGDGQAEKMSSDRMGKKHSIGQAVYVAFGSVNPLLANKNNLRDGDVDAIKKAISAMFSNDISSARPGGSMEVVDLIWWEHDADSDASSAKVHRSLNVNPDGSYSFANTFNNVTTTIVHEKVI